MQQPPVQRCKRNRNQTKKASQSPPYDSSTPKGCGKGKDKGKDKGTGRSDYNGPASAKGKDKGRQSAFAGKFTARLTMEARRPRGRASRNAGGDTTQILVHRCEWQC
eukprot:5522895-Amphidinium_carterae.1